MQREGFITHSRWLKFHLQNPPGRLAGEAAERARLVAAGKGIFQYHCGSCHAYYGYNGIIPIIYPWTAELIDEAVRHLHRTNPAMPPWLGTEGERGALAAYLVDLNREAHAR
jgi:mono/diheme cytochrome c family protein